MLNTLTPKTSLFTPLSLSLSFNKYTTICPIFSIKFIIVRTMYRSKDIAAKTTYNLFSKLLDPEILNKVSKKDHSTFIDALFSYSFDPNDGALQHKGSLLHMLFRQKYLSDVFKEHYFKRYPDTKVSFFNNLLVDFRIFSELPVIQKYEQAFYTDIKQIVLTNDSIKTTFEKQVQANPDMIVNLIQKSTYQDVKSGLNITKHFTRGSLGLITFDSNKELIAFSSENINLYSFNKERLKSIGMGLLHDNLTDNVFKIILEESSSILNTENDILKAHLRIQDILWKKIQCNPLYNRSVSFVFLDHQDVMMANNNKYETYHSKFLSLLQTDKTYNPNKIADRKHIFNAMLRAYREIDNDTKIKLDYIINNTGILIDNEFLSTFASLIKETLI